MKKLLFFLLLLISLHAQTAVPVVIIGGGIAGMTAALQISQAGLTPLLIMGPSPGGIITVSHDVENWPGELSITGADLADKLQKQLEERGIQLIEGVVKSVDFSRRPFTFQVIHPISQETTTIQADSCIITMGATPNLLQIPGEKPLLYHKIFTCAPCDGLRFKDQNVAVIGGGESSLIEAHYLSGIAKHVTIIVRGKEFKTIQPALKEKVLSKPNVTVIFQTTVKEFKDDPQGIELKLSTQKSLLVQGAFLAIGSHPNTDILKEALKLDSSGYIVLDKGQSTSVPGVFAAGDVCDPTYKQAITASGDATKAALDAIHYLSMTSSPVSKTAPASSSIIEISDLPTLQSTIKSSDKPLVVYFSSPGCMPCRSFKPLYEKWSAEYSDVAKFLKINAETCPACFLAYKIQGIPAVLIITPDGEIQQQAVGTENMVDILKYLEREREAAGKS